MVSKLNRTAGTHKLQAEVAQAKAASKGTSPKKSSHGKSASVPVKSKAKHATKAKSASKIHRKK
jgi:hypothetical protein